jgi:hypothetical protein
VPDASCDTVMFQSPAWSGRKGGRSTNSPSAAPRWRSPAKATAPRATRAEKTLLADVNMLCAASTGSTARVRRLPAIGFADAATPGAGPAV